MMIVLVLDVKKVAFELYDPFTKAGAPQQTMTATVFQKILTQTFFVLKVLIEVDYMVIQSV